MCVSVSRKAHFSIYLVQLTLLSESVHYVMVKNVHFDIPLTYESLVYGPAKEETQEFDVGCFKAYAVSFCKRTEDMVLLSAIKNHKPLLNER